MTHARGPYPAVDPNPDFPKIEESVLRFWQERKIFERSVESRPHEVDGKNNEFIFYDGPPFANGLPHYGHLLTGFVKDAIARYQTMRGRRVERRFGWDCHGLPAEMAAEKELGISGRAEILDYGIEKFNEHCRVSVMKYTKEWEYYVTRQGRWVDFRNDYKTMDTEFMESVLWAFKQLYDKGLVYESFRVMPYSWAAETPLSNFETRLDNATREREDKAVMVAFTMNKADPIETVLDTVETYKVLAWTTTPWTLPSNLALAVGKDIIYVIVEVPSENTGYIFAGSGLAAYAEKFGLAKDQLGFIRSFVEERSKEHYPESNEFLIEPDNSSPLQIRVCKGSDLIGLSYEPLFPYFREQPNAFKIIDGSDFVTDSDGTGIVHIAPGFGEDDQRVAAANGMDVVCPVDIAGRYTDEIYDIPYDAGTASSPPQGRGYKMLSLRGLNVIAETVVEDSDLAGIDPRKADKFKKDVQSFGLANMRIIDWLDANKKLIKQETIKHNYPHCWRTDTPLIYRAMPSWYVDIGAIKEKMTANNQTIRWIPDHVRDGQMGKGIESAPDWSISRNRFWGTPIPIWRSDNPNSKEPIKVFGSIAELEAFFDRKVEDLHRPYVDALVAPDGEGYIYRRIEDVFDCWFESGSMPYAQFHYPFENKEKFEANFPADFITEYVAQTRGWFYTLQVLSAALFESAPFKNCICHGVVIDEETGLKYSKRLKNYKDPKEVMDQYGADALRWMMLSSPVMHGADLAVDPGGKFIRDVVRLNIKPLWSAYNFFTLYANADGIKGEERRDCANMLDRYILAKCDAAVATMRQNLDAYDVPGAAAAMTVFLDVLNNWYIRRSRPRFWAHEADGDKQAAYDTLFAVLTWMTKAAAPLLPFVAEEIYRGLHGEAESVHLQDYPNQNTASDIALIRAMDWARDVCNAAFAIRNRKNIRTRQPLQTLSIIGKAPALQEYGQGEPKSPVSYWNELRRMICDEVNVKEVDILSTPEEFEQVATRRLQINSAVLAKRLPGKMKEILPASKKGQWSYVSGSMEVAGERLNAEEYDVVLEAKPEYADLIQPLPGNDAVIRLDLNVTPELAAEGIARDVVRLVQQARKDAGLNVSDRIALGLGLPEEIRHAVRAHEAYIADQTLTATLSTEPAVNAEHRFEQALDGQPVVISLSRVA